MIQTVFNRIEKKYMMPADVYEALIQRLSEYMHPDEYGATTICNIYFDTEDDLLIRRSIEKPKYKEKLRLRSYGVPDLSSPSFLEIKKKYDHVVNKRRISIPLQAAYRYITEGVRPEGVSPQMLNEFDYFFQMYNLKKGVYLAYDRVAWCGAPEKDFRVTFDQNIRYRTTGVGLENGDMGKLLLPQGTALMETKIMGATPLWFTRLLSELKLYPVSFSKIGNAYKHELTGLSIDDVYTHALMRA